MFNLTYAEIQDILNKAKIDHLPKLNISILRNVMVESHPSLFEVPGI